ncbi:MAG: hypothetical protein R3248_07635 [Candidatus Promineifilaceae bacterium]|nr:hypothetical protein [Candidatus Promineifilaceae bacterium]
MKANDPRPVTAAASRFDDVWNRDVDLCAYCAGQVSADDEKCPNCGRTLVFWRYAYPQASSNLHIVWVLLAGAGQLFFINALTDLATQAGWPQIILHAFLGFVLVGLAAGVYFRRFWAYATAIVVLIVLLFLIGLGVLTLIEQVLPAPPNPTEAMITGPFVDTLSDLLRWLQTGALALGLLWAVFLAGSDFERVQSKRLAEIGRGLVEASDFDLAARQFARDGLWASAVLHWQRAAARAPYSMRYLERLAGAYARLGFMERSLDALASALPLAADPTARERLDRTMAKIERLRKT